MSWGWDNTAEFTRQRPVDGDYEQIKFEPGRKKEATLAAIRELDQVRSLADFMRTKGYADGPGYDPAMLGRRRMR